MTRRRSRILWTLALTATLWQLVVPAAGAYIDPGSGSYILQLLAGAGMAAALGVRIFWRRLRGLFSRRRDGA